MHDDIWELNWSPISDWQAPIKQIELTVQTPFATPKTPSKLYAHTGYFGVPTHVNATEDGYDISISGLPIRGRVELHSYWEKSGITNYSLIENQSTGKKNELAHFKQTEDRIVYGVIFSILFAMIFPILSVSCYLLFRKKIKVGKNYPKDTLLYEIPQNLPPLVVASNIYSVELNEVNPTEKNYSKLKFKNMIQATLLDLIDRGNLKADEKDQKIILTLQHSEGLLPFEKDFVTMAFGEHAQLSTEDLFSDFTISDSIYKELKKNESAIRSAGTKVRINIDRHLNKITRGVNEAIARQELVNHYRPLNKNERILINAAIVCSVIPIFTSMDHIYDLFYSFIINANTLFFLVLDILSGALCYFLYQKKTIYIRDGVLNEEGTLQYYYWNSFENMLKQIANLQQAELESIVLWNRILVYATLYGCADKVNDTIKIHQIHIKDQNMSHLIDLNLTSALSLSSNRLYNYGKTASAASNFSVSSSDSGGGFSGGGGGGAF